MRRFSTRRMMRTGFRRETKRNDSNGWSFWSSKKKETQNPNKYQRDRIPTSLMPLIKALLELVLAIIKFFLVLLLWAGKFFLVLYGLLLSQFTRKSNRFIEPYIKQIGEKKLRAKNKFK